MSILAITSCGSQKELSKTADSIVENYLNLYSNDVILVKETSNQYLLSVVKDKYNRFKNHNSSPLNPMFADTLKLIFSEKNIVSFTAQLEPQETWAEKPYIKQTIISLADRYKPNYINKTIIGMSYPVITLDKKFALMQFSLDYLGLGESFDELIVFIKRKGKWVVYKRFELSLT